MKNLLNFGIIICCLTFTSCKCQEKINDITINYIAQTRGYIYSLHLEKNLLEINDNNIIKKGELSKPHLVEIDNLLNNINFKEVENNISIDDLSVDKTIKGTLKVSFNKKVFEYEFNHNKLPKDIQELFKQMGVYLN